MLVGLARRGQDDDGREARAASDYEQHGGAVLLASTDVYRPAAREQLAKLAADLGVGFFESDEQRRRL